MAPFTDDDLQAALRVLAAIAADRGTLAAAPTATREALQRLAGEVSGPDRAQRRRLRKALARRQRDDRRGRDDAARRATGIQQLRALPVFETPRTAHVAAPTLPADGPPEGPAAESVAAGRSFEEDRKCYVCKQPYAVVHHFYDQLCPPCATLNFAKRTATVDLRGRVAVVTGARVKIGYQAAILLLRAGCTVVACTRFPRDAARRYAAEADFADWRGRLHVYGIDLRRTPSVEQLAQHLTQTLPRLDFQIHNACQTVRRPPGFYAHLVDEEHAPLAALAEAARPLVARYEGHRQETQAHAPALLTQTASDADLLVAEASAEIFPRGVLDQDLQQVDLRTHNSWRLTLGEVPSLELLEVLLVNAAAPFVMASKLKGLMTRQREAPAGSATSGDPAKHIVMVSAMEGQFYRGHKTDKHPHTNMAKAALNMLVRTSAIDYAGDAIYLNAVDTGWVTDEDPAHLAARKAIAHRFTPPLDIVDGAARIVDPIVDGFASGRHRCGFFFKDYAPTAW